MYKQILCLSKWFYGFENKKQYLEKNIDEEFLPIIDFKNNNIILNDTIKFYEQAFLIIENTLKDKNITDKDTLYYSKIKYIIKYIGTLILIIDTNVYTNYLDEIKSFKDTIYQNIDQLRLEYIINYKITPNYSNQKLLLNNGWYSSGTKLLLEGSILLFKPKIIVELGVYYAKSTLGMLKAADSYNISYYGFDNFTHCANNRDSITMCPIDKLFMKYPKLDTCIANVAQFSSKHNINFILYDCLKSLDYLKNNNIIPDLLFIDAIKNPAILVSVIDSYLQYNPNIIIVGDDLEGRHELQYAVSKYKNIIKNKQAYVIYNKNKFKYIDFINITNNFKSNYIDYPKIVFTKQEINQIPKSYYTYLNT